MSLFNSHESRYSRRPQAQTSIWPARLCGVFVVVLAVALMLCLLSYKIEEVGVAFLNPIGADLAEKFSCTNYMSIPGMYLAGLLFYVFGGVAWLVCALLLCIGLKRVILPLQSWKKQWFAASIMAIFASIILALQPWVLSEWADGLYLHTAGGMIGYSLGVCSMEALLGETIALILALVIHAIALVCFAGCPVSVLWGRLLDDLLGLTRWVKSICKRGKSRPSPWDIEHDTRSREQVLEGPSIYDRPEIEEEDPYSDAYQQAGRTSSLPPRTNSTVAPAPQAAVQTTRPVTNLSIEEIARRRMELDQRRTMGEPAARAQQVRMAESKGLDDANLLDLIDDSAPNLNLPSARPRQDVARPAPVLNQRSEPAPAPTKISVSAPADNLRPDSRPHQDDYPLPPYSMLSYRPTPPEQGEAAKREMEEMQRRIIDTLTSFGIAALPGDITRGPSITRYEVYPPKGYRVNRINNLRNDLMLATRSASVNILAPVPGKNTVGIELANAEMSPVYLRELLQDAAFSNPKSRIPVALGKDVYGRTVIGDLAAMPHTLVAGTTGSGKSVCINSMIISMLYKFRPDELKLVLVDPKVVEMQPYRRLPHLACPVVTEPSRVIGALRWAVNEMEHRYRLFSKIGVRNFEDFNNRPEDFVPEPDEDEIDDFFSDKPVDYAAIDAMESEILRQADDGRDLDEETQDELDFEAEDVMPDRLPYIVIIIDELADLMMVVKEDLENYIARLTQKARAAGIHLVVATQTPRSAVVTGMIKANIPSRIAFKVSSPLDSRIILDTDGAENLLGKGDCLFLPPGGVTRMMRAQGAFVSDEEVSAIVKFCASNARQNFVQGVTAEMNNADGSATVDNGGRIGSKAMSDEDAELYTRCVNLVVTERKASTSLLQRRFSIGYGRAAKMMDYMEDRGVISSPQGATRAREVLVEPIDD